MTVMTTNLFCRIRSPRLQAASTVLLLLLQRTPVLRYFVEAETGAAAGVPQILRSAVAVAAALGAVDTVAGATTFVSNPSTPAHATVNEEFGLVFSITGSASGGGGAGSWTITGPLPPGLGIAGAVARGGDTWDLNKANGAITGTPTETGTWDITFKAWEKANQSGESWDTEKLGPLPVIRIVVAQSGTLAFTSQPMSATVAVGGTFNVGVTTSGTPAPTLQWRRDGTPIAGANGEIFSISPVSLSDAGSYDVVATNTGGSVTSDAAVLTVTSPAVITSQPVALEVVLGGTATFSVTATGTPAPTYQWRRNGLSLPGRTDSTLTIDPVTADDVGVYTVRVQNSTATVNSDAAELTLAATAAPEILRQPESQVVESGGGATFLVDAGPDPELTYQWHKGGVDLPGATRRILNLSQVGEDNAGAYAVRVTRGGVAVESEPALLSVSANGFSRLSNLSTRTRIPAGGRVIPGFVIKGSAEATVLVRAVGPTLGRLGVDGTMPDPQMRLVSQAVDLVTNNDWGGFADQSGLEAVRAAVGAFELDPGSADAALTASLAAGPYSLPTTGVLGSTGVVLVELYDGGTPGPDQPRLVNLSARAQVGTGANLLIPGFVIEGNVAKTVLIRAVGPTLADFKVEGVLLDPNLRLFEGAGELAANDDWGSGGQLDAIAATAATVGAFPIDSASKDSALLITLNPGAYTVKVSGVGATTGVCLVEVYEVPPTPGP